MIARRGLKIAGIQAAARGEQGDVCTGLAVSTHLPCMPPCARVRGRRALITASTCLTLQFTGAMCQTQS